MIARFLQTPDEMSRSSTGFSRFLYHLTGWLRCRVIRGNHGEPYLERYHLFRLPGGGGAYIHRFLDSDPDRGLHDHPWRRALGIVLSGRYLEQRLSDEDVHERILGPGRVNRLTRDDFHRIVPPQHRDAWTIYMQSGRNNEWGFLATTPEGVLRFTPHEKLNREGSHEGWWRSAPRGRAADRQPLGTGA